MSDFQELIQFIRSEVNRDLKRFPLPNSPAYLYNPIRYTFRGSGKRFRPILVHLSGRAFHVDPDSLMKISLATELLHNFTLVHDDIMDHDDLRHGQQAVHKKWDESTAILTGDALCVIAQILLNNLTDRANNICCYFNEATLEVCEGQALDKEFENISFSSFNVFSDFFAITKYNLNYNSSRLIYIIFNFFRILK